MWKELLQQVWGDTEGYVVIARQKHNSDGGFVPKYYEYPGLLPRLLKEAETFAKWGSIYFSPVVLEKPKKEKENVKHSRCIFIDLDRKGIDDIEPQPTMAWKTSNNNSQAIWVLKEPIDPKRAERLNRYMAAKYGADKGSTDMHHYLRFPESKNFKYDPPQPTTLLWDDGPYYAIEELEPSTDELEQLKEKVDNSKLDKLPEQFPDIQETFTKYGDIIPRSVYHALKLDPETDDVDRSWELWKIYRQMMEAGIPKEHVYVVVHDTKLNKFKEDQHKRKGEDPDEALWKDIQRSWLVDPIEPKNDVTEDKKEEEELDWIPFGELLTHTERPEWLIDGWWMDANVGWIAGTGKSYKTVISLDMAISVASGAPFLGQYKVNKPGPVLMIQEEDPMWRVASRSYVIARAKGLLRADSLNEWGQDVTQISPQSEHPIPIQSLVGSGFLFQDEDMLHKIEKKIAQVQPRMVMFDPWFMMSMGVDEFKSSEIVEFLRILKDFRNRFHCSIVIVHHYNKGSGGTNASRLYGSHALYSWSENALFVNRIEDTNVTKIDRDIKDAEHLPQIKLEVYDIQNSYSIKLLEEEGTTLDQILNYLSKFEPGIAVPLKQIEKDTDISSKTISNRLKELHKDNMILLEKRGQGGALHAVVQPPLHGYKGVEVNI